MRRREFTAAAITASANTGIADAQKASVPKKNNLMHVGGDYHSVAGPSGAGITSKGR